MILLHQSIGYLDKQLSRVKLPKFFSAETCRLAAAEIATIARNYLASSPHLMPLSPQFCFCLCVSAKALLGKSKYLFFLIYGVTIKIMLISALSALRTGVGFLFLGIVGGTGRSGST